MFNLTAGNKKNNELRATVKRYRAYDADGLRVTHSAYQSIGKRQQQEDAFAFSDLSDKNNVAKNAILAVVADGMGGLDNGGEASRTAVDVFLQEYLPVKKGESALKRLNSALAKANTAVFDLAFKKGEEVEVGTTLIAALIEDNLLHWVSVGDSRIYLYRRGALQQLTRDHIYKNVLLEDVKKGLLTMVEADEHPEGAYLTSYLGLPELPEIDCNKNPLVLEPEDRIILCSDGLYNTFTEQELKRFFDQEAQFTAEDLIQLANDKEHPYQDNLTVIILTCHKNN